MANNTLFSISLISFFLYTVFILVSPSFSLQKSIHTHNVKITSFLPSNVCNRSSKVNKHGSIIEILHKHSPCNKNTKDVSKSEIFNEEMFLQDQLRVNAMHVRVNRKSSSAGSVFNQKQTGLPLESGIPLGVGNYYVTVALGTPKADLSLLFDTGSDISWTQCEPCLGSCYQQAQPKFDPRKSSSYRNVSCSSSSCQVLRDAGSALDRCSSSTCLYGVAYGDGSYSIGFYATEKLTVAKSDVFNDFLFGCGQQNIGRFGQIAGLIGFGRSQISFAFQTAKRYKNLFSYCIPPSSSSTGHLSFGGRIGSRAKFTPLSPAFEKTPFYGLEIIGISVGGDLLPVEDSVYTKAGAIIDSGTVITRLQPTVYSAMKSKFKEMMKDYPATDGASLLDTCYDFSDFEEISVPIINFFLKGGVEVEVHLTGTMIAANGIKKVCLAFAPNSKDDDFAVFGNTQQKTYEVVHDLAKGRVGFVPAACS